MENRICHMRIDEGDKLTGTNVRSETENMNIAFHCIDARTLNDMVKCGSSVRQKCLSCYILEYLCILFSNLHTNIDIYVY